MEDLQCCGSCETHSEKPKNPLEQYLAFGAGGLFVLALGIEYEIFPLGFWLTLVYLICYVVLGHEILKEAAMGLIKRDYFNENTLMAIASLGAWFIGEGAEAVAILLFYRVGEFLEDRIVEKSRNNIRSLQSMKISTIRVLRDGQKMNIDPKDARVGDEAIVLAGERIGVDGVVLSGSSHLDTSALTGESLAVGVCAGDEVLSGSINIDGELHIQVTKSYDESTFSQVIRMIEEGSAQKSRSEEFITRFARIYTPAVTCLAALIAIIPPLYLGMSASSFEVFLSAFSDWFSRGLIFLVISCPCALVISIPLSFFVSLGRASSEGILIKGSSYLETLYHAKKIVFDKTGTITQGELKIAQVITKEGYSQEEILAWARALEEHSNHPIAQAILRQTQHIKTQELSDITEQAGGGVRGYLGGEELLIGNAHFMLENQISLEGHFKELEQTQVFVAFKKEAVGCLVLEDSIKPETIQVLKELKELGITDVYMLSGDKKSVVQKVADQLGIKHAYGALLPADKVGKLKEIISTKGKDAVIFVGDGINDAPSLALSDVGVAMGKRGSDVALEGADVVVMNDHLSKIPLALRIAQKTRQILWQNIIFALGSKAIIMLFGVMGMANMWIALLGDVGVAILALLNARRGLKP